MIKDDSIGIVEPKYFTFAQQEPLCLESGETLSNITVAYETYGQLSEDKSNAILIEHALTGDAHGAGWHEGDRKPGWWETMIGPGKAFDTDKYFIVCSNVLGGCKGTTGPSSIDLSTGKPYALSFPLITIADMVEVQRCLLDFLGIERLLCVAGGSMGGMQALQWVSSYPKRVRSAIPIATTLIHSAQQIAFSEVGRQAVMADPNWDFGNYYGKQHPEKGLSVARMIGHITYMSDQSMQKKFSRKLQTGTSDFKFNANFEVEGYLRYRGDTFVKRFDANSYLYLTKALDYFDVSQDKLFSKNLEVDTKFLVIGFKSDWLYPLYQTQDIARQLKIRDIDATYCEVDSTYGHDAFLLEVAEQSHLIKHFLKRVYAK